MHIDIQGVTKCQLINYNRYAGVKNIVKLGMYLLKQVPKSYFARKKLRNQYNQGSKKPKN